MTDSAIWHSPAKLAEVDPKPPPPKRRWLSIPCGACGGQGHFSSGRICRECKGDGEKDIGWVNCD